MSASNKYGGWVEHEHINSSIFNTMGEYHTPQLLWENVLEWLEPFDVHTLHYYHLPPIGAYDADAPFQIRLGLQASLLKSNDIVFFDLKRTFVFKCRSLNHHVSFQDFLSLMKHLPEQKLLFHGIHCQKTMHGFIIPCHSANGRTGAIFAETKRPHKDYNDDVLRLISQVVYEAHKFYCALKQNQSKPLKHLTSREKEILTWVAHGKSNSVIADIIGISQHTVNGYLRSIYLKTNTSDRTTAVLRGLGDGLIDL